MRKIQNLLLLFLLFAAGIATAQTATKITGTVSATDGHPLSSVSVVLKGAKGRGTTTDANGKFTLTLPAGTTNPVLVFTSTGYRLQELPLAGKTDVTVQLQDDQSSLDDVVVVGYQTVKRKDLTGSVASVGEKELKDVTLNSAEQAITGRLAGVQVTTAEGSLDADVKIVVRGGASITQDNSPLYVVDGVQVEDGLRSISPQDIERIDVLKDASATAIYGSRGANGVVLVTTKSGKSGAATVNYNGYVAFNRLPNTLPVLSPYEFAVYQWERTRLNNDTANFRRIYRATQFSELEKFKSYTPVDWQRQVMGRTAMQQTHNVSVNGGTATTKYNISYTYNNTNGIIINTDYDRHILALKLDQTVSSKLKVGLTTRYTVTNANGAGSSDAGNAQLNGIRNFVKYKPYLDDNEAVDEFDEAYFDDTNQGGGLGLINPVAWSLAKYRKTNTSQINIGAYLAYTFNKFLSFRATGGLNNTTVQADQFNEALRSVAFPSIATNTLMDKTYNLSNVLTYSNAKANNAFSKKNDVSLLLGQETYMAVGQDQYIQVFNYPRGISPENALTQFTQGTIRPGYPNREYDKNTLLSFFGRANYAFMDKYLFAFTLRADGSSKFASGQRWGYFPSGAFSWRLSKESFMQNVNFAQDIKLRFTYGVSGNNRIPSYAYQSSYTATSLYALNNSLSSYGYGPTTLANPNLTWESTVVRNLGLDFTVLKNRLNVSVDVYSNRTNDVITRVPISPIVGYTSQLQNTADTRNNGVELQLSSILVKKKKFSWNADFNITSNRNTVQRLSNGLDSYLQPSGWVSLSVGGDYIVKVGSPVGSIWGYVNDGYYSVDDFDYDATTTRYTLKAKTPSTASTFGVPQPGSIKIKDINGDGTISDDDKQIIGNATPKFYGGLNQQFTFGNFDASIFVNFQYGNDLLNANKIEFSNGYLNNNNLPLEFQNRWRTIDANGVLVQKLSGTTVTGAAPDVLRELNKNASIWIPIRSTPGYFNTDWAVEDGSFLRVNNITVGYSFNTSLVKKIKLKRFRVYATTNNLFVLTSYSGYDPEVNTRRATGVTPGVDYSAYPRARNFTFGVNCTF